MKIWACAGLLAAAAATSAAAQTPLLGGKLYPEFDVGGRTGAGVADSAKQYFNLYRDVNSGLVLQNLRLWFVSGDGKSFADAYARDAGLLDQRYHALFERSGRFRFTFDHDATPHFLSSTARAIPGAIMTGDSLGLPATRTMADTTAWKTAPIFGDVTVDTKTTRTALSFTPLADLDVAATWDHVARTGQRPMGLTFSGSSGPAREGLEPIDHAIDRFRFAPSFSGRRYQATVSYEYSGFRNGIAGLKLDNPVLATSTTAGSSYGQTALAPSNQAHTFAASGGYSFSTFSRLTAAFSFSMRTQNEAFLPRTVNSALDTSRFLAMPASLNGEMHTAMANLGYTTRLDPKVTFSAHYTYFSLTDRTPPISFWGRVNADRAVQLQWNTREQYPYSRQSATAEVTWRALPRATVRLSDNWQAWNRELEVREVAHTSEHTPKLALDATPLDWLSVQTSYRAGHRYGDGYVPVTTGNNRDLVRYDEGDRSTRRFDFDGAVTPLANTSIGFQYGTSRIHYDGTPYGLQKDDYDLVGADVMWSPSPRISVTAGAMRNTYDQLLRSRYRSGVQASNIQMDWITDERDTVTSYDASVNLVLIPRTLEASISYSYVKSSTNLNNSNPYPATGVDSANAFNSRVTPFPPLSYSLQPLSAVVRYTVSQNLTVAARVSTEDFASTDFRTGGLLPYTSLGTQSYYYLGNSPLGYGARYFTFTVSYRPWVPGLRHAVM